MNQTNGKDITLTALEAHNIHAGIFELLTKINDLTEFKKMQEQEALVSVEMDGGDF
jgi:hypothetical protein